MRSGWVGGQHFQQFRQSCLDRVPYHFKIDIEVAVSDTVAHTAHAAPRHVGILRCELSMTVHDLGCSLADNNEAHDDGLLRTLVVEELISN